MQNNQKKGSTLFFDVDGKTAFDIPLNDVSQSQVDKNDVSVIFQRDQNQPNEGVCFLFPIIFSFLRLTS